MHGLVDPLRDAGQPRDEPEGHGGLVADYSLRKLGISIVIRESQLL